VPAYDHEGRDAAALERVWADAEPLDLDALQAPGEAGDAPSGHAGEAARGGPPVRQAAPLPDVPLALVAGKGGVGKTTVAAATALRRGEALQQSSEATGRVLCASTDPAHSLATALDRPVGDEPTPVAPGVDAVEIDATARFEALRRRYVDDVRQFFARTGGPNVDFSADRRVAEGLMNLAPPGIDEVMGWIAVMEFLDGDRYHACVLDTAPTGHFARFLELPAVFEEWIRTLFRILQSYEKVIRVPDLVDRLVRLSRSIKRLRTRLASADESAVVAVTLPESMVWAETEDLVACAEQNGVPLPLVVLNRARLNRARPSAGERVPGDGGTADSARLEEKAFLKGRDLAIVEEGVPPRGVAALAALGQRLYQPVPVGQDAA
jgi:arsenite-transporting ATPase